MPVSFKPPKTIYIVVKTPTDDLEFCDTCGGINAMASTAVKIDCTECGTTGYSNYWTRIAVNASYRPGGEKRWDADSGTMSYFGECSIKLPATMEAALSDASHIEMDGKSWSFNVMRNPGEGFGQKRLVISLSRK